MINNELNQANIDPGPLAIIEPSLEDVFIASMRSPVENRGNNEEEVINSP
jgi:hypothetical protein